jgi:hypothetical protein
MAGAVFQDDNVAGEERTMRAAEIEQHAVVARHLDHAHLGDHRRAHRRKRDFTLLEQPASPARRSTCVRQLH